MKDKLALLGGPKTVTLPYPKYPIIDEDEICGVVRTLMSGQLSDTGRGGIVAQMEDEYAEYFGTKYALGFSSGTAAIHCALFAVGVRPGSEVLTANHNWISGITAILHAGGTPILCDVKPGAFHIDAKEIRRKVTPHTKAIVVTHLWGLPADLDPILKVARELNLAVIEDCSHAHGGKYKGQFLGTIGDIGCFSLQGSKAIVAGEGGVMLTNSKRYYERAMVPGHHAARLSTLTLKETEPFRQGGGLWTYRMAPLAASVASAQLRKLDRFNTARQANSDRLQSRLKKSVPFIKWPTIPARSQRGWYGAPAFYEYSNGDVSRDLFVEACSAEGMVLGGEGYTDWSQIPLFQDVELFAQMWPVRHHNGVGFEPLAADALPNNQVLRRKMMLFPIPAIESFDLMDQAAAAVEKVAANMSSLAGYKRKKSTD